MKYLASTQLARVISVASNPIFILTGLPVYLVFAVSGDTALTWRWTLYTWSYLLVFVIFVLYGVRKKVFSDIDVSVRRQRPILYSFGALLSVLYLGGLIVFDGPNVLVVSIIGILIGILIGSLVNLQLKVSVHAASASALLTMLGVFYRGFYVLLLLLIPIICWARVKIKRHTVSEVIAGSVLGGSLSLVLYLTVRNFELL